MQKYFLSIVCVSILGIFHAYAQTHPYLLFSQEDITSIQVRATDHSILS
jgi:hypothetical protein